MSELIEQAEIDVKNKNWSKAAIRYLEAIQELIEKKQQKQIGEILPEAYHAAKKAEDEQLQLRFLFDYEKFLKDKETKKELFTTALPLLNRLIKEAEENNDLIRKNDLLTQKITALKTLDKEIKRFQKDKGITMQEIALQNITNRKEEEREEANQLLNDGSMLLHFIEEYKLKVKGEITVLKKLFEEGYIQYAIKIFNDIIDYAIKYQLEEEAEKAINYFLTQSKKMLKGETSWRFKRTVKKELDSDDPGLVLLDKTINQTLKLDHGELLVKCAKIITNYTQTLFQKKKIEDAIPLYEKALQLKIESENVEEIKKTAQEILQKTITLLKRKRDEELVSRLFLTTNQLAETHPSILALITQEKADYLFESHKQVAEALNDYQKAAEYYLKGENQDKFIGVTKKLEERALQLIIDKNYEEAYQYINRFKNLLTEAEEIELLANLLQKVAIQLLDKNPEEKWQELSEKAIDNYIQIENIAAAGKTHEEIAKKLLEQENYENATFHYQESARLYQKADEIDQIQELITPLKKTILEKISQKEFLIGEKLADSIANCGKQINEKTEGLLRQDFGIQFYNQTQLEIAFHYLSKASEIFGLKHAELLNNLTQKVQKISLELLENNKIENSEKFSKLTLNNYQELEKYEEVADFLILYSNQLFTKEKNELGKDFLKQISMILNPTQYPEIFTTKVKKAGKLLINQKYYSEGIKLLQKVSGVYLGEGENTKLLELINYCKDTADKAFNEKEMIGAKHLYISAMEFSNLVDLEEEDKILAHATEKYLGINDYYSVKEFYDFAKNNYEGEKDYLAKLARLILYHATILREEKNAFEEANEFIILGTTILQQNEMYAEAAEAFLAHGLAFSNINELSISEELIQTAAKIFVEIEDLERSGDVFLALTKINIKRGKWEDAYRQIQLAIKSYKKADLMEKVRESIEQLDIIAIESINEDPDKYDEFTFEVYETAISEAKQYDFQSLIVDLYLNQARSSLIIGEYIQAKEFFDKGIEIIEQLNQAEKGIELAKELSETATSLFGNQKVEEGIELVDLATSIHMKLGQPLKASEIYFRSCNSLFKINKVVEGVKLILLASDTLMVAGEHEEAINILQEIIDLLFKIKDYEHAAMCIGQIVSHYQKTGNIKKQKEVIKRLVDAAQNVIEEGKIKDGEDLWDSIAKFSISVNLDFAIDINNQRVENLLNANMFNSVNKAFKEILTILDKGHEELKTQGEKTLKIAKNLLTKEEDELAYNFTITAINFYKKAEDSEKAKDLAIDMSKKFIVEGFEDNGILLVDEAAKIANEIKGSHEAATIYLKTGFHLLANGYPDSGELAVNKAVEIDLQTENLEGCKELGEMTIERAKKIEKNNISQAIAYYNLAITIFEKVTDFVRAGETAIIITTKALKIGDAKKALQYTETAIDYFLEADKIEMAEGGAKLSLESARQFLKEGEITKSVLILERGRLFVEKIGQFDLLSIIVNIYLTAASQHLPNRKSNIGIFFLKRAIDLANSSPNPDEMSKVLKLCQKLALEIINKKNALAGAKVLEIIADQPLTQDILKEELAQTYLDALHLSIKVEWNVIGKITRDSINYFEKTNQLEKIAAMIDILLVYVKEFLKKDRPKIAFFYLDEAIRVAKKAEIPELEITIGLECYNFILDDENTLSSDIEYQLLGYSYEMFNEVKQTNNIKNVGLHFADLASEDLEENIFSPLPYDIIIHTRHIAVRCQCVELMRKTIKTLLLIATQLKDHHPQSILGVLEDIIEGLEAYEIPQTNKIEIKREEIEEDLKTLRNHAKRLRRNNKTYRIGQKIEEDCLRILVFTNNMEEVNDYLEDTMDDLQRILRRSNPDGAYRLRHAGILYLDLNRTNEGTQLSEHTFRTAVELGQKKKFDDSLAFSEATLKLFSALANNSGLQELGKFASDTADKIAREGDIHEAMIFYDLAVEAYDEANDKESAIALITLLFQQREWDADVTVAYKVYKLAADSALRRGDTKRLMEVCNKCLNRGIAFIDQPRLPIELSYDFTVLAARKMEEGGQLKDAANAYDSVILKYLQLLDERKNLDDLTANLLVQTAFTRLATSDMDSLETITLRFNEYTELKKSRYGKTIEKVLKVISKGNISQAWELLREIPIIPFGQQYHILESVKEIIVTNIEENGRFDRTVFSTTDRSKTLSDFLLNSLIITRTIHGKEINRDVFISEEKLIEARANLFNEFELWGRIDITEISKKMSLTQSDILSIIRREFMPSVYLSVMDNDQSILYSFERLKAEISLQINQFKKENTIIDPMKIANEMRVSSDIIKEVIRELKCDEVVEEALVD